MTDTILLCRHATGDQWAVGAGPRHPVLLVGWSAQPDAGVPGFAASVAAAALTALGYVSFPTTSSSVLGDAEAVTELPPAGLLDRILKRSALTLVSTRKPSLVQTAFNDPAFPWWLQGQFLLITGEPPQLHDASSLVQQILRNPLEIGDASLAQHHAHALVLPGVDGDLMGIRSAVDSTRTEFAAALQSAAEAVGIGFVDVSEAEFADRLAGSGH